jgi:uncharacterized Zn finger protein
MSERASRVAVACPSCSPGDPTVHEVLKPGGQATVRCTDCGHTHKTTVDRPREVTVDVVVSQDGESFPTTLAAEAGEEVTVGDEFVVDTPEAIMQVRATAIERPDREGRVDAAPVEEAGTVWTRVVDNVSVDVTLHPSDGRGRADETRSLTVRVPGDYEFVVGAVEELADEEFEVEGIVVRDDAPEYRHGKFDHDGDTVFAKDAKRVYGRDQTSAAWSAW